MMMPPTIHGRLSPSKLPRILNCPGSLKLGEAYDEANGPPARSIYAEEGTMLHHATEIQILGEPMKSPYQLTEEQVDAVEFCTDFLSNLRNKLGPHTMKLEANVYLQQYDPILYDCHGTSDVVLDTGTELHVVDWKFGAGIQVFAQDNEQLMTYGLGAAEHVDELLSYDRVFIYCVQPRFDHIDIAEYTPAAMLKWLRTVLIPGAHEAYDSHPRYNPGQKQCQWCPAKGGCKPRHDHANEAAKQVFALADINDNILDLEAVEEALLKAESFEKLIADYRTRVAEALHNGEDVKYHKLVMGRSNRKWKDRFQAEEWMLEHAEDFSEVYKPSEIISPAVAEKRWKKKDSKAELQELIVKPPGKLKLARLDDPRPAAQTLTAKQVFKDA